MKKGGCCNKVNWGTKCKWVVTHLEALDEIVFEVGTTVVPVELRLRG
jgi:hypothetical protein